MNASRLHLVTLSILLLLVAPAGCRRPRQPSSAGHSSTQQAQTRTQAGPFATRPPAGAQPANPASPTRIEDTGTEECTVSLLLNQGLVDCSFAVCPREFAATLTLANSISLTPESDGSFTIRTRRSSPPFEPEPQAVLRLTGPGMGQLELIVLPDDSPVFLPGQCRLPPSWPPTAAKTIPVKGISIRMHFDNW